MRVSFYKMLFYVEAFVHESILLFANRPFVWAPLLTAPHRPHYCTMHYTPPGPSPLQYMPSNIRNGNIL